MGDVLIQDTTLSEIADAIRERNKKIGKIKVSNMADEIRERRLELLPLTDWSYWFAGGRRTDTVDYIDTSNGTKFESMFSGSGDSFNVGSSMYAAVQKLNTSNGTDFIAMFERCQNLERLPTPIFDTSKAVHFTNCFYQCFNLSKAPDFNTSSCKYFDYMFYDCRRLTNGGVIDMRNIDNDYTSLAAQYMFAYCPNLKKLKIIVNGILTSNMLRIFFGTTQTDSFTDFEVECTVDENGVKHGIKVDSNDFSFAYHKNLSVESLLSILNALEDNTGEEVKFTVYLGSANLGRLTAEQKQIAYNKNLDLR